MKNITQYMSPARKIFLGLIAVLIVCNMIGLTIELNKYCAIRRANPFMFAGDLFTGLSGALKGVQYIGYYTDKDFKKDKNAALFAQVQFGLAPIILDLNNLNHHFILFNCEKEETAWAKIKEIHARPLKRSSSGFILAETDIYEP